MQALLLFWVIRDRAISRQNLAMTAISPKAYIDGRRSLAGYLVVMRIASTRGVRERKWAAAYGRRPRYITRC